MLSLVLDSFAAAMVNQSSKVLFAAAVVLGVVCHFRQPAFVPAPARRAASLVVPAAAAVAASAPAFADEIGD